jgi:hypothetical protein
MKKIVIILSLIIFSFCTGLKAQVLNVPEVIQEQTQWCWAGVSKCILDYYGYPHTQCEIAEYARTVITWTSYGTTDCCVNPNVGCNYWNYNYGYPGSIQDILLHFGSITGYGTGSALSLTNVQQEITAGHPFVVRWGWAAGGGHFVVGHGINGSDVYYMNPWFNEGLHVSTYAWLLTDGNHTWTHTNVLTSLPTSVTGDLLPNNVFNVYPNPTSEKVTVNFSNEIQHANAELVLSDVLGKNLLIMSLKNSEQQKTLDLSSFEKGIYFITLKNSESVISKKLILQ